MVNAAMLLGILVVLIARSRGQVLSTAFADVPQQAPIAGGGGVFVMPAQLHRDVWGCYLVDVDRQTLCTYEYRSGERALVLTAARHFRYDLSLKNFNTYPAWYDLQKMVDDEANAQRSTESKPPVENPESTPPAQ